MKNHDKLGWIGIVRLGLVQGALGAIVVLTTSTMNRVMVVEVALPAMLPGMLVALHYAVQLLRPRLGYGSDVGGRRTPWIVGGMAVLAVGGIGAATATAWMGENASGGITLAIVAFALIGIGVGACGTNLLVLLAKRVDASRRPAAATIVWLMMIVGFIVTAAAAGELLDPYSPSRLVGVTSAVAITALLLTVFAVRGVEGPAGQAEPAAARPSAEEAPPAFRVALQQVLAEPQARRFTIFVFVAMLAYSAQDLILEPFAGLVFGLTPGESTKLAGLQHGGVLAGMALVALLGRVARRARPASMRNWTVGGCIASAAALLNLAGGGLSGPGWPLHASVFFLGAANGAFAVAAIAAMMELVSAGRQRREGVRMGLWGAAQAMAFAIGGFLGTATVDLTRHLFGSPAVAYATVFTGEALLFLAAAVLALRISGPAGKVSGFAFAPSGH